MDGAAVVDPDHLAAAGGRDVQAIEELTLCSLQPPARLIALDTFLDKGSALVLRLLHRKIGSVVDPFAGMEIPARDIFIAGHDVKKAA